MGKDVKIHAKTLSDYAKNVLLVEDKKLKNYNSESYQQVLSGLIKERKPWLTLMGHTSSGIDLAPRLAVLLSMPLATDCLDPKFDKQTLAVTRQMYGGQVNVEAVLRRTEGYMATIRQATFPVKKEPP